MSEEVFDKMRFFEEKEVVGELGRKKILVAKEPMTQEQARLVYPYRPYNKYAESHWGGDTYYDDVCLLLNSLAKRCKMCHAPTKNKLLDKEGRCPDCNGDAHYSSGRTRGINPHSKS